MGGTAAGAAAFNIVPVRVLGKRAPGNRIAMGMIGLGGMGFANMESFLALDDVSVRAVCDVNARKMQAAKMRVDAYYGNCDCKMVGDFRALCARPDIDAVMIATPNHGHATIGIEAALGGKDIYGEKPFSHTLSDGRALVDAIEKAGCVWQTGNRQRSQVGFSRVAAWVRNGGLGAVARVEVGLPGGGRGPAVSPASCSLPDGLDWTAWLGTAPQRTYSGVCDFHWRWVSEWGGGMLMDGIGLYGDIAQWGAARDATGPVRVEGSGLYVVDGPYDTATSFSFRCRYEDGLDLVVADGGRMEKGVGVRWLGRNGEWVWVSQGALEASTPEIRQSVVGSDAHNLFAMEGLLSNHTRTLRHYRNFIDCVKTRQSTVAPAEAAHRAASLGHLGQIAMRSGHAIRFDPRTETILA